MAAEEKIPIGGVLVTPGKCPKFTMDGRNYHFTLHQEKKHVTLEKPNGKDEAHYFFRTDPSTSGPGYVVTGYKEPGNHDLDELKNVSKYVKENYTEILKKAFRGKK
ncbi:hypothetical protein [Parabacteroides provencensis]|uniref:hypothetical protein n=1 Tax=Parabacteroides provencensis TaxID=1944636 RepID=UPI000C147A13|nr:hypothetical protein [Parabacteroides provencensis]